MRDSHEGSSRKVNFGSLLELSTVGTSLGVLIDLASPLRGRKRHPSEGTRSMAIAGKVERWDVGHRPAKSASMVRNAPTATSRTCPQIRYEPVIKMRCFA
jgi:hypothetical protein